MYRRRCTACAVVCLRGGVSGLRFRLRVVVPVSYTHLNEQVILCERGIRTFEKYTRNTLDLSAVPIIHEKTHLPVSYTHLDVYKRQPWAFTTASAWRWACCP